MTSHTDYDIVRIYGAEYRGIVQYYLLAGNVSRLQRLHWVSLTSMLKTLAVKHRTTVSKIAAKHKAKTSTPSGPRRCFEAIVQSGNSRPLVARFGGIPLIRQKAAVLDDRRPERVTYPRKELINRLLEGRCELCGSNGVMHVHHIRALAELAAPEPTQPQWNNVMAKRRRKTLVVCDACHDHIHQGTPAATRR
jgi:hypothetical protein